MLRLFPPTFTAANQAGAQCSLATSATRRARYHDLQQVTCPLLLVLMNLKHRGHMSSRQHTA